VPKERVTEVIRKGFPLKFILSINSSFLHFTRFSRFNAMACQNINVKLFGAQDLSDHFPCFRFPLPHQQRLTGNETVARL
jgi:hypothetical protein